MCNCVQHPNVNGEPGYRWNDNGPGGIRQPSPPSLLEGETLIYDEPGRCGGLDGHSHHFQVVQNQYSEYFLAYKHGGGEGRIAFRSFGKLIAPTLAALDTHARYWLLYAMYSMADDARSTARKAEWAVWHRAALEGRIKVNRRKRIHEVTIDNSIVRANAGGADLR